MPDYVLSITVRCGLDNVDVLAHVDCVSATMHRPFRYKVSLYVGSDAYADGGKPYGKTWQHKLTKLVPYNHAARLPVLDAVKVAAQGLRYFDSPVEVL